MTGASSAVTGTGEGMVAMCMHVTTILKTTRAGSDLEGSSPVVHTIPVIDLYTL